MSRLADPSKPKRELLQKLSDLEQVANARLGTALRVRRDFEQVWIAEMLAVSLWTYWEHYGQWYLIARVHRAGTVLLSRRLELNLPSNLSYDVVWAILAGIRNISFRGYDGFLSNGDDLLGSANNPFRHRVAKPEQNALRELAAIRNHVLHGSAQSLRAYRSVVLKPRGQVRMPTPGTFLLRSPHGGNSRIFRYIKYVQTAAHSLP